MSGKIKASDFLAKKIKQMKIKTVYGVIGGAVMHIFDSLKKEKISMVFCHHEQAALLAATTEARLTKNPACAIVTQGPGVTNAITGLAASWFDSVPCLIISGQARSDLFGKKFRDLRQLAPQAFFLDKMLSGITKSFFMPKTVNEFEKKINNEIDKLQSDRPGPIWIDLPVDIQWSNINNNLLKKQKFKRKNIIKKSDLKLQLLKKLLLNSSRPLVLIGSGVNLSNADKEVEKFIHQNQIPCISSWNGSGVIDNFSKLYLGRPGIFGQRGANYILQQSDLILVIGSGLSIGLTTYNFRDFGRSAKKIMINIDKNETNSSRIPLDLVINEDIKEVFQKLNKFRIRKNPIWLKRSQDIRKMNDINFKRKIKKSGIADPYFLTDNLSKIYRKTNTIYCIDGGGIITQVGPQMLNISKKNKLNISAGICTMGCLPETISAKKNFRNYEVIFLTGDGSLMMNIQELQTLKHYNLNVKIFVLSNGTYGLMTIAQKAFFNKAYVGSTPSSGVSMPNLKKICNSFEVDYFKISKNSEVQKTINLIKKNKRISLCEVFIDQNFTMNPVFSTRVVKGKKIIPTTDEMEPYLNEKEKI